MCQSDAGKSTEQPGGVRHHPEGVQTFRREIFLRPEIPHHTAVFRGQGQLRFFFAKVEERKRVGTVGQRFYVELCVLTQRVLRVVGTVLSVTICILYAYPLFRRDYKFRSFFSFLSFFTMIFGGGLIPTYIVCKNLLGLSNNYAALIVPMLVSPFNIIIMRTFLQTTVPFELIEASTIDGAGEYTTLCRIVLPIMKPGIATVALLTALGYWNEWFLCMLYVTEKKLYPLQYLLMEMQKNSEFLARNSSMIGASGAEALKSLPSQTMRMAVVVFIVLPIACAYPFFQRYVVAGLTIGSVKG